MFLSVKMVKVVAQIMQWTFKFLIFALQRDGPTLLKMQKNLYYCLVVA